MRAIEPFPPGTPILHPEEYRWTDEQLARYKQFKILVSDRNSHRLAALRSKIVELSVAIDVASSDLSTPSEFDLPRIQLS